MRRTVIFCLVVVSLVFSSCTRRGLNLESDGLRILLRNNLEEPYRTLKTPPYHFCVLMYGTGDGRLVYEDFCPTEGGPIMGVSGSYRCLVYDLENTSIQFRDRTEIDKLYIYTGSESEELSELFLECRKELRDQVERDGNKVLDTKGGAGFEDVNVIREPGAFFAGVNNDAFIPATAYGDEEYVLPVDTKFALCQGQLVIHGVQHTEYISSVRAFITNMSSGKYLASDVPDDNPAVITFTMPDFRDGDIKATYNYFGKLPEGTAVDVNTAYIVITGLGGEKYLFVDDISDQVRGQGDNPKLDIEISFDVPKPAQTNTGFQPVVDNWVNVIYNIPIGNR